MTNVSANQSANESMLTDENQRTSIMKKLVQVTK